MSKPFYYSEIEEAMLNQIIIRLQLLPPDQREYIRLSLGAPSPELQKIEAEILGSIKSRNYFNHSGIRSYNRQKMGAYEEVE